MENKKIELLEKLSQREVNMIRVDGALTGLQDKYEINSGVLLSMVLYSHMLSFAYYSGDEAVKMVQKRLQEFSSYDLKEVASNLLGVDVVEHYKEIAFADYAISENPIIKSLEEASGELTKDFEDMDQVYKELNDLIHEDNK